MIIKKKISIVIPCHNEELNIENTYRELKKVTKTIKNYHYEYIFVDNGSCDKTREEIRKIAKKDKEVIGIFLPRNFGIEASGQAGCYYVTGDAIVIISCDLQDPPSLIPKFLKKWEEGNLIVFGTYTKTVDIWFISLMRKLFYKIFKIISNIEVPINTSGFGLLDKKVVEVIKSLPEKYRFMRGLIVWTGFRTAYIPYERQKRKYGKSSYNIFTYLQHAERGIFGFSYLLLDLIAYFGFILVFLSFLFIILYLAFFILFGNPIKGAVTIVVLIIFFGGIQLLAISIIGKYIQVIVEETKARPTFIVEEVINFSQAKKHEES